MGNDERWVRLATVLSRLTTVILFHAFFYFVQVVSWNLVGVLLVPLAFSCVLGFIFKGLCRSLSHIFRFYQASGLSVKLKCLRKLTPTCIQSGTGIYVQRKRFEFCRTYFWLIGLSRLSLFYWH